MNGGTSVLVEAFLPIAGAWLLVTALVTVVMLRLGARVQDAGLPRISAEVWGAVSASGAAGGGVVGFSLVAPSLSPGAAPEAVSGLLAITAGAMLLGAVLTAGLVLLAVWLWTGGA